MLTIILVSLLCTRLGSCFSGDEEQEYDYYGSSDQETPLVSRTMRNSLYGIRDLRITGVYESQSQFHTTFSFIAPEVYDHLNYELYAFKNETELDNMFWKSSRVAGQSQQFIRNTINNLKKDTYYLLEVFYTIDNKSTLSAEGAFKYFKIDSNHGASIISSDNYAYTPTPTLQVSYRYDNANYNVTATWITVNIHMDFKYFAICMYRYHTCEKGDKECVYLTLNELAYTFTNVSYCKQIEVTIAVVKEDRIIHEHFQLRSFIQMPTERYIN